MNQINSRSHVKGNTDLIRQTALPKNSPRWPADKKEALKTFVQYYFQKFNEYKWTEISGILGESADECQKTWNLISSSNAQKKEKDIDKKKLKRKKLQLIQDDLDITVKTPNKPMGTRNLAPTHNLNRKRKIINTDVDNTKPKRQKLDQHNGKYSHNALLNFRNESQDEENDANALFSFWRNSYNLHLNMIAHGIECQLCSKIT